VSFRSGKKILQLVDAIFEQKNLQNAICKISKYSPHISHRNTFGYAELWAFEDPETTQDEITKSQIFDDFFAKKNHFDDKDNLAKFVAHKIKDWIAEKRIILDKNRQIEYGDIMILVRNRQNGLIDKLANNFSQLNIPFVSVGKIKFSENLLIQDFLSIARFALLPIDCYNLACLLKSPFFNLSDQDLLVFCKEKNQQNLKLWNILQTTEFNENLQNIINISKNVNCFEFYYYILNDPLNQKNIVARFGSVALEIINNFLFICQDFYLNDSPNLQNFIEFIDKIDPEINLSSNQQNRVKITTVHSSKGLQAPIVILPDCLYSYSKQSDNKEKIIWDENFPLWINSDSKINNCIKELYDNKILQNYEEHLRLLYVALTRAEDEIYIGGLSKTFDDKCWYNLINNLSDNFIKKVNYSLQLISSPENNVSNNYNFDLTNFNYINDNNLQKFQLINQSLSFGEYLHKALEIIGKNHFMPKDFLLNYLNKYFSNHLKIDNIILVKIIYICKKFIDSTIFNEIFKDNSPNKIFCEYEINNEDLNLRIDLLKISDSKILIIDYKSDDNPPDKAPQQYLTQLENYKIAVQKIYPHHQITAKILWIKLLKFNQEI
jgi:ATP-dependent helicase/nuclease subunit A